PSKVPSILLGEPGEPLTEEDTTAKLTDLVAIVSGQPCDPDRSINHHAEKWKALQMGSDKSAARKKMNCHMLNFFLDFLGTVEVGAVTEACWQDFFFWLQRRKL